jgi:long-chain acyl-CoA synthetase
LNVSGANILVGVPRLYDALVDAITERVRARGPLAASTFDRVLGLSIALARRGRPAFGRIVFSRIRQRLAPALRRLTSGGAALGETTEETLIGLGFEVLVGYGLTETSPLVTFDRPGRTRVGSAGEPLSGDEVRIAHPAAGGVGEIEVRGPNVFAGYRNDPAATSAAFTADGWFRTGDLGRFDADGYLFIQGRSSETLVLPGGEKLNPETVEGGYETSPTVGEIAVLLENGKLVGLVVPSASAQGTGTEQASESAIRAGLTERANDLPRYMQLSGFALVEGPLPRTPLGKLRRHLLLPLYRAARARQEISTPQNPELSWADRALLEDPTARRLWKWLEARFPHRRLSLEMSPQLDLGVDSLEWIALTMDLERTIGITLDEAALERVATLRNLVETAMAAELAAPAASAAEEAWLAPAGVAARGVWYVGHALNRLLMRLIFRLRVEGVEHLPQGGPYVLCPNHSSYLDGLAVAAALPWPALRQLFWAGASHVMFASVWRRVFSRLARVLPIDPIHGARTGLALSAQVLCRDRILVWFPEGSLTKDGTLQPFLPGIGSLVLHTPVPIVPVRIKGTLGAWLPEHRLPRPRRVTVCFGPPLDPGRWTALGDESQEESIAAEVKTAVSALE